MHTRIFTYGLLRPTSGQEYLDRMLLAGNRYRNAYLEIERDKQQAIARFYAEAGGYTELLNTVEEKTVAARKMRKDNPERKGLFDELKVLRKELYEQEEKARDGLRGPEEKARAAKTKELKAEAKAAKKKLSEKELVAILDATPGCVSPRRQVQLDFQAEYEAKGKKVSAKKLNQRLRDKGLVPPTQKLEDEANELKAQAREFYGIHWATTAYVTEDAEKAIKTAEGFPRFKRFDGTGRVGIPVDTNAKLPVHKLHDCKYDPRTGQWADQGTNILRVVPVPDDVYHIKSICEQRRRTRTLVRVRVGSDANRQPQWVEFPCVWHRPLPKDAVIVGAWIKASVRGTGIRYDLQLQVQSEGFNPTHKHGCRTVAVNFGHRASGRVCYTLDDRGQGQEFLLPARMIQLRAKADEVKAARGNANNLIRDSLLQWLKEAEGNIPEAFLVTRVERRERFRVGLVDVEHPSFVDRIKSLVRAEESLGRRLQGVYKTWERLRETGEAPGHDRIFGHLREWAIEDKRSEWVERGTLKNIRLSRKHLMINWAHAICDQAEIVLVENTNYALLKRRDQGSTDLPVEVNEHIRYIRDICAPGEMRAILEEVCKKRGVEVKKVDAKNLTVTHHACGHKRERSPADKINVVCPGCEVQHDQDRNFCEGLFGRVFGPPAREREQPSGKKTTEGARKRPSSGKNVEISP